MLSSCHDGRLQWCWWCTRRNAVTVVRSDFVLRITSAGPRCIDFNYHFLIVFHINHTALHGRSECWAWGLPSLRATPLSALTISWVSLIKNHTLRQSLSLNCLEERKFPSLWINFFILELVHAYFNQFASRCISVSASLTFIGHQYLILISWCLRFLIDYFIFISDKASILATELQFTMLETCGLWSWSRGVLPLGEILLACLFAGQVPRSSGSTRPPLIKRSFARVWVEVNS